MPADIGPYPAPDAYAEATAKAQAYLFATADEPAPAAPGSGAGSGDGGDKASGGDRQWAKAVRPVRAALLGVSVAVVLGTAAVGSGAVPGLEHYRFGGGTHTTGGERTGAVASPGNTASGQGGTSGSAGAGATAGSGDGDRPARSSSPSPSGAVSASKPAPSAPAPARTATEKPSPKAGPRKTPGTGRTKPPAEPTASAGTSGPAEPSASGTPAEPAPEPKPGKPGSDPEPTGPKATPSRTATPSATPSRTPEAPAPAPSSPADTVAREAAVEAEVLKLVNDERAKAGLGALAANSALTGLAEAFSDDMAARGFFAHTDPDGSTPWDRAARAGITGLGAENIGRGQADAAAVLAAWMDSPENRANILNPGFTAVGAGVHLGPGGPWWTLEFGT
ncbi:CAP domain-containing protein [Streptomyces rubradiris]|uniref:Membrane protein n=1 Tax=Streptomyces rubradiris TaxID=285531 RepID=A0ABQ3RGU3_STRRR|nr:CAP domain-containing protein [Streptomyces rubradiris]GHH22525.1 membrane protein [Streptomyces rubradiris]GHI55079.1 membrane protein [Streptomyces rubradiris]